MAGSFVCFVLVSAAADFFVTFKDLTGSDVFFAIYKNSSTELYEFDKFRISSSTTEYISSPMIRAGLTVEFVSVSDGFAQYNVAFEDTLSFYSCFGCAISQFDYSPVGGGSSVDLSSVLNAIISLETNLSSKIDSLDLQIPDDLNSKLSILQTNIQNLDLSSLNIGDILLGSSLNGNMCRYKDGDTVRIQGLLGDFTVVWSNFLRFGDQDYTVFYQVSRDVGGGVLKYQFVPEALVFYPTEVI